MIKLILIALLCICSALCVKGEERYSFSNLTVKDGLSQVSVNCTYQDSKGYIWFGTRNGLNRFDGYVFETFYNDVTDSTSISNNQILCITEDSNKNLWIGTRNGLNKYDPSSLKFGRYMCESYTSGGLQHPFVFALHCDNNDRLWVGSQRGLNVLDIKTNTISVVNPDGIFTDNPVNAILGSRSSNTIYIATRFLGVIVLNTKTLNYKIYNNKISDLASLSSNDARSLFLDKNNNLWVGTYDAGVNLKKDGEDKFVRFTEDSNFARSYVRSIAESPKGEILVGTSNGLYTIHPATKIISQYNTTNFEESELSHFSIYTILYDAAHTLWIGTYSGGIDYYSSYGNRFITHIPQINGKTLRSTFSQIVEVGSYLYVATEGDGLLEYDWRKETYKLYKLNQNNETVYSKNILKTMYVEGDIIYCGTASGSIFTFNTRTKQFSPFYSENEKLQQTNVLYGIKKDADGNVFFCAVGNYGFQKIYPDGRVQKEFPVRGKDNFVFSNVVSFLEIEKNVYLIGTRYDGLYRYDFDKQILKQYARIPEKTDTQVLENQIWQIFKDSYGRIWLAIYGGGLTLFDPKQETFTTYSVKDGLLNNNVCMVQETKDKQLWVCTSNGISSFDSKNKTFKNYSHSDGININEFSIHPILLASSGQMFLCGDKGFVSFDPYHLSSNPVVPPIVINNFYVNNKKILPGGADGILTKRISYQQEVELNYTQSNIAIEYAALNFASSGKNQYAYILEGFDDNWNHVGTRRMAYYTNIPPGTYTFRVKGSNNDGLWNDEGTSIKIKILPPLWKTWWAYSIYLLTIVVLVLLYFRYQKERQRLKNDIHLKKLEAKALEEFHEERNKLFTNFSHELRSPLTLLISPFEEMADDQEIPAKWKNRVAMMRSNAQRLLRLVNNLMDFTKKESGSMPIKVMREDIVKFADEMHLLFSELALSRNINLKFSPQEDVIEVWFDRNLIEKVFFNLLSNAIKNTPNGGSVEMRIKRINYSDLKKIKPNTKLVVPALEDTSYLLIEIEDSGVGIPPDELQKIFNPFYQVAQNEHASSGTGLGLSLSKSIVEMHHGEVWAENAAVSGAVFRSVLPIGENFFEKDQINENNVSGEEASHYLVEIPREELLEKHSKEKVYTILVVEDNADVRHYIASHLVQRYNVMECSNGFDGLEKAIHYLPDLIISDLMMYKMDGLEMCHKLKNDIRTSHIPVIMITARTTAKDIQLGFDSEVDDYITKPFVASVVMSRVENLLKSREKLKEIYGKRFDLKNLGVETTSLDEKFMQKLYEILGENFSNSEFNLDDFCKEIGMSRTNFYRKIKAITDMSPSEFIRHFRLEMAAKILKESSMPVSEIYVAVGFNSHAYFSNSFKSLYGISPSEYANSEK